MYNQLNMNRQQEIDEIVEKADLSKPVTEAILRAMTLDEIKYFRDQLFHRVENLIRDDLNMLRSDDGQKALPETSEYRQKFYFKQYCGSIIVEFDGKGVFYEGTRLIILGEWIEKLQNWAREAREELAIQSEIKLQNERDKLIKELLGEPV